MHITIDHRIYFHGYQSIQDIFKNHLTMINPEWTKADRLGFNTFHIPKKVTMYKQHDENMFSVPRGVEDFACQVLDKYFPEAQIDDHTCLNDDIEYECNISPYDYQFPAIEAALSLYCSVLSLPTGGGKTVVALYLIAARKQKTFILVHTKDLMYQWQERIKQFLNYDCGLAGDGKFKIKDITVGIVQTVRNRSKNNRFAEDFGYLIIDECHRVPSSVFVDAVSIFKAHFITGLTATPSRKDGFTNFIFWSLGDLAYKMPKDALVAKGKILKPKIVKRETNLLFGEQENGEIADHYGTLIKDLKNSKERNNIIASDILSASKENFSCCLVLSDHEDHLNLINQSISEKGVILTGKLSGTKRKKIIADIHANEVRILLATASLISEGFDFSGFTHLFLTMPVGSNERLEQMAGRLIRSRSGKNIVTIYDYVDKNGVFQNQYLRRIKVYNSY